MKVVVKDNSQSEDKLVIYENVRYIDFSSGIAILINDIGNKYVKISEILSVNE